MKHADFSLYLKKEKTGLMWYAKFWNHEQKRFTAYRSLKIKPAGKYKRRNQAFFAAQQMVKEIKIQIKKEKSFVNFLTEYWALDGTHVKMHELETKKKLTTTYIKSNLSLVNNNIARYEKFNALAPADITAAIIRDYLLWENSKGANSIKLNKLLKLMRIAMTYLYNREEISGNPFDRIKKIPENLKEKGVLTKNEGAKIIGADLPPVEKSAILFGLLCGMRIGEVQGLQWDAIDDGKVKIATNWQFYEGLKEPKSDSARTGALPQELEVILKQLKNTGSFVFSSPEDSAKPLSRFYLNKAFCNALEVIGISKEEKKKRNITFHSLRHTFITNGRLAGIPDVEIMAVAGHKNAEMMEHYTHAKGVLEFKKLGNKISEYYKVSA